MALTKRELADVFLRVQQQLVNIERLLGPPYKITIVCRYVPEDLKDADIVITKDDLEKVQRTIDKMKDRDPMFKPGDRV